MRKKHKKQRVKAKSKPVQQNVSNDRRAFLRKLRNVTIGLSLVGAGGAFAAVNVKCSLEEGDLTKVGNGMPTIVQIHDPQCPRCQALQKETRKALGNFDDDELQYLVANIRSTDGQAFANKYHVPHITILLFDGKGELTKILRGNNTRDFLRDEFAAHLKASARS